MKKEKRSNDFHSLKGRCPVCSQNLVADGKMLKCGEHYWIDAKTFEAAWQKHWFQNKEANTAAAEALLKALLDANVAPNKVFVNPSIKNLSGEQNDKPIKK